MKRLLVTFLAVLICSLVLVGLRQGDRVSATVPGVNELVSANYNGSFTGNNPIFSRPYLSRNGEFATFTTDSNLIVHDDTNGLRDVFLRNLVTEETKRINLSSSGVLANGDSYAEGISRTGRYVAFESVASNLIDGTTITSSVPQVYLRDTVDQTTYLLSQNASGQLENGTYYIVTDISSDGRFVLLRSNATNLDPAVTSSGDYLYMLDRDSDTYTALNTAADGTLPPGSISPYGHMSCDGSMVVFSGYGLTEPDSGHDDIYLLDRRAGNKLTDITYIANGAALDPTISCNGDYIGFYSEADNLDATTDHSMHLYHQYVYDRINNTFTILDQSADGTTWSGLDIYELYSTPNSISNNGLVAFPANDGTQIYIRDISNGNLEVLSKNSSGVAGDGSSRYPSITSDGSLVLYNSQSDNLLTGDSNGVEDIFTSLTGY